jgi:hypothetical protein
MAGDIPVDKVPAALRAAADKLFPKAKWADAHHARHDDEERYELLGEDAKGASLSVEGTIKGAVTGVEREIDPKDLPKPVTAVLKSRFPKFTVEGALAVYAGDNITDLGKAELTYQLNGEGAKGKDLTVELAADGTVLETRREVDVADLPKPVVDALKARAPKFHITAAHRVNRDKEVVGYLLASRGKRTAFVTPDGANVEIHTDD